MRIFMAGMDHTTATVEKREPFAFTKSQAAGALAFFRAQAGVAGTVLLCTCNRTELYLSVRGGAPDPAALLARAAHVEPFPAHLLQAHADEDAARHLMQVACGLRSALRGDDQIPTQVRQALEQARAAHAADPVLETLFRLSVTAAKQVKSEVRLRAVPVSAAAAAVKLLAARFGRLDGRRVLVVGNGEMGRAAAELLVKAGCAVTVTLRSYRHGETVVPYGCSAVPYDERLRAAETADILLSATASPHFTFTREMLQRLPPAERCCIDLAVPRDIDPAAAGLPGLFYAGIDALDMAEEPVSAAQAEQIRAICESHLARFSDWCDGRILRETADELTESVYTRVRAELEAGAGDGNDTAYAVRRTVEALLFSLKGDCTPELLHHLRQAAETVRLQTR